MNMRKIRRRYRRLQRDIGIPLWVPMVVLPLAAMATYYFFVAPVLDTEIENSCVVVVDRTGSSADEQTTDRYRDLGEDAIEGCAERGAELGLFYFDQQLRKIVPVGSEVAYNLNRSRGVADAIDALNRLLDRRDEPVSTSGRGSDILTALDQGAGELQILRRDTTEDEAFMVILTDGIQCGTEICVDALTSDPGSAQPLVAEAEDLMLIPNLLDVDVSMVGVRSGKFANGDFTEDWFESSLEVFWSAIIDNGGGSLCRYSTEASSLPTGC